MAPGVRIERLHDRLLDLDRLHRHADERDLAAVPAFLLRLHRKMAENVLPRLRRPRGRSSRECLSPGITAIVSGMSSSRNSLTSSLLKNPKSSTQMATTRVGPLLGSGPMLALGALLDDAPVRERAPRADLHRDDRAVLPLAAGAHPPADRADGLRYRGVDLDERGVAGPSRRG